MPARSQPFPTWGSPSMAQSSSKQDCGNSRPCESQQCLASHESSCWSTHPWVYGRIKMPLLPILKALGLVTAHRPFLLGGSAGRWEWIWANICAPGFIFFCYQCGWDLKILSALGLVSHALPATNTLLMWWVQERRDAEPADADLFPG